MVKGLLFLAEHKIVHSELNPQAVLLSRLGEVKIGGHCDCRRQNLQDDFAATQLGFLCLEMMNSGIDALSRPKKIEPSLDDPARQSETAVDFLESAKASAIFEIQSVSLLPHVNLTALMELRFSIDFQVYVSAVRLWCQMSC